MEDSNSNFCGLTPDHAPGQVIQIRQVTDQGRAPGQKSRSCDHARGQDTMNVPGVNPTNRASMEEKDTDGIQNLWVTINIQARVVKVP